MAKSLMRLLAKLTPDQRIRYEFVCRSAAFDGDKVKLAERILYEAQLPASPGASD